MAAVGCKPASLPERTVACDGYWSHPGVELRSRHRRYPATKSGGVVPARLRVVIVDPSPMARAGLTSLIQADPRFTIVAEGGDCASILYQLTDVAPDLLIADPGPGELSPLASVRLAAPDLRILVLAESDTRLGEAVRAGADGFLLKHADGEQILAAIDQLLRGQAVLDPELALHALRSGIDARSAPEPLTARELEVLRLLSEGKTNPQIARRLFVAVGTVKVHVEHILSKLGATHRTDAVVRALSRGILDEDPPTAERHMPTGR
jgi:DNA-binding NarL/FixJ family response regulator